LITASGLLIVGPEETADSLKVRATSRFDPGKYHETVVIITGSGNAGQGAVTGVTVSPSTATVIRGDTQQFIATVTGTNSPAQTVTWSVTGGGI
jgi:uncharacterized protein YjdB